MPRGVFNRDKNFVIETKQTVQYLLECEGLTQREISSKVNVSESSIIEWVKQGGWIQANKQRQTELRELCQKLIEVEGLSIDETVLHSGVKKQTLISWICKRDWKRCNPMEGKKEEAKKLIAKQHWSQKEAAELLNVSEKTIGKWCKEGNWLDNQNKKKKIDISVGNYIKGLKNYIVKFDDKSSDKIISLIDEYTLGL